jgi:aubergine
VPSEKSGKLGQNVKVLTNYVGFRSLPLGVKIIMYDANFAQGILAKTVPERYRLLKSIQSRGELKNCALAYDGRLVFATSLLSDADLVQVKVNDPKAVSNPDACVSLRKIIEIAPNTDQWYRVVNVIFNLCQQLLGQKKYGNDYFVEPSSDLQAIRFDDPSVESFVPGRFNLRDSFELLQGYSVSLHRCQFTEQIMPIMHVGGTHRMANLRTLLDELEKGGPRVAESLPGRTVLTRYNNKTYIIGDVLQNASIDDTFDAAGQKLSYRSYFQQRYGLRLTRAKQPFMKLKLKRVDRIKRMRIARQSGEEAAKAEIPQDILIPSELCYLTGFNDQEKMAFQRDAAFNNMCRKRPNQRAADVSRFCQFIVSKNESRSLLQDWKMEISSQPLSVPARVLDSCFRKEQRFRDTASINTRSIQVVKPAQRPTNIIAIAVVQGGHRVNPNAIQGYVSSLQREARNMGFEVRWVTNQIIVGNNALSEKLLIAKSQQVDIVLVALDDQHKYKEIKSTAVEQGILTQVVRGMTITKPVTAQKVALQMACKVGFAPWKLGQGLPDNRKLHMIVGIDTFSGKGATQVQAAVFSLDTDCSQYYTSVTYLQGRNMEFHANIANAFKDALVAFKKRNNKLPDRILVYRDGVGDSQLLSVKESEVKSLETLFETEYGGSPFHMVFTVVKKRISQRFFMAKSDGSIDNVRPGTIVDTSVTKPNWLEYYIVPQDAGQGTATPSNFNIIYNNHSAKSDNLFLSMDDLQRTTFALTHLYFNWSGTIRVPAPVQYAHKCAFLLGQCSINTAIHRNIRENLFYL